MSISSTGLKKSCIWNSAGADVVTDATDNAVFHCHHSHLLSTAITHAYVYRQSPFIDGPVVIYLWLFALAWRLRS